jgi:Zn-dependent M28 family amino/carboxypeptidase
MVELRSNKKRIYDDVDFLTSIIPARNYANKSSLDKAAAYIYEHLSMLKPDKVEYQEFDPGNGQRYKNISALFQGQTQDRIIIGAHYDVCGDQPGADDNASAVAGMLETARILNTYREVNKLKHTLEFVGYCLEEPPFFATQGMGSAVHAKKIHEDKIPLKLMICYEMIGYFSDEPYSQTFPHPSLEALFPNTGNFIVVAGNSSQKKVAEMLSARMKNHCQVPVYPVAFDTTNGLADLSDHRNYWRYGYNAVMINDTSFLRNPHYHLKSDTIDKLDFQKMGEVINGVAGAVISLDKEAG